MVAAAADTLVARACSTPSIRNLEHKRPPLKRFDKLTFFVSFGPLTGSVAVLFLPLVIAGTFPLLPVPVPVEGGSCPLGVRGV